MPHSGSKYINPWRYANAGSSIEGEFAVSGLPRLVGLLRSDSGVAAYKLSFSLDERSLPVMRGFVTATVEVTCQRCLEPMALIIRSNVDAGIARIDDEESAPTDLEVVLVENDRLSPEALVEDELILALPSAPLHPAGACSPPAAANAHRAVGEGPFGALSKLKSGGGENGR